MHSRLAIKNIITSILLQFTTIICGFILPRIIVTTYGSSINGLVSSITQFLSYITLLDGGIGMVIKAALYAPIARGDKTKVESILRVSQKFLNKIVCVFVVYVVVLCVVYPIIANFEEPRAETVALILAISLSTVAEYAFGLVYKLYLQAKQQSYTVSVVQMVTLVISTLIAAALIRIGCSISVVKLAVALVHFVRAFCLMAYVRRRLNIHLGDGRNDFALKGRWDGFVQHAAAVVHENTDVVILTIASSATEISVYSIYNMVLSGTRGLIRAFSDGIDAIFGDLNVRGKLDDMNSKLKKYEFIYYSIIAVLFGCEMVLITPFIEVYMNGVTDANYYRPVFGFIIVASQALWAIRQPYSSIALAAGKFKETKRGAMVEALTNILVSLVLVWKFGLIGVAAGTFVAMLIRTLDYINYTSTNILKRRLRIAYKHVIVFIFEVILITIVSELLIIRDAQFLSYFVWIRCALVTFLISILLVGTVNFIAFRREAESVIKMLSTRIKKR